MILPSFSFVELILFLLTHTHKIHQLARHIYYHVSPPVKWKGIKEGVFVDI